MPNNGRFEKGHIPWNTGKVHRSSLEGKRFGKLIVISYINKDKRNNALWLCKCDCGGETITRGFMLRSGRTKSCGCYHKDITSIKNTKPRITVQSKVCPACKDNKLALFFGLDKTRPDGLTTYCKHCKNVEYKRHNKGKTNHLNAKRKIAIKIATPKWIDLKKIEKIYNIASQKTMKTGISYHVDHIVPITSSVVCGLHVPWNLQILTESENCSKQNSFTVKAQRGIYEPTNQINLLIAKWRAK